MAPTVIILAEDYLAFRDGVLDALKLLNERGAGNRDPAIRVILDGLGWEDYREGAPVGKGFRKEPANPLAVLRTVVARWKAARNEKEKVK